jgi:hypothetical protein
MICMGTLQDVPRSGRGSGQPADCCSHPWHDHSFPVAPCPHGLPVATLSWHTKQTHKADWYVQEVPPAQPSPCGGKADGGGQYTELPAQEGSGGLTLHWGVGVSPLFGKQSALVVQCGSSPYSHSGMSGPGSVISGVQAAPASGTVLGHQGARTTPGLAVPLPLLGPETPLLDPETPLLDPPVPGATLSPQPTTNRPAKSSGAAGPTRPSGTAMPTTRAAYVPGSAIA